MTNSTNTPAVVIRPIRFPRVSANHRAPSGPTAIPKGARSRAPPPAVSVGSGNSAMSPVLVIRPILLPSHSVNHRTPSGPATIPPSLHGEVGTVNSRIAPAVVIRPILQPVTSTNHSAPSGPTVIDDGRESLVGRSYTVSSVTLGAAASIPGEDKAIATARPDTIASHQRYPCRIALCPQSASSP